MAFLVVRKIDEKLGHKHINVMQIFDSEPSTAEKEAIFSPENYGDYALVEYPFDPETEVTTSLVLSADGTTLSNPWAGKTIQEQRDLHEADMKANRIAEYKADRIIQVKMQASMKIETLTQPWKIERATEQDLIAGNNDKMRAIAVAKQEIRDASNAMEAEVQALTTEAELDAYNPYGGALAVKAANEA
jgi:hypothetical protein|tara:strand:+ start:2100 stop:2666 length:567 start_codon:yes stop_codon:yes gene_type:complete